MSAIALLGRHQVLPALLAGREASAICFCRVSIARISGGQMNLAVNQMKRPKPTACISRVRLMFIAASGLRPATSALLEPGRDQRVAEREQHRDAERR